jgi:hypothetical protein
MIVAGVVIVLALCVGSVFLRQDNVTEKHHLFLWNSLYRFEGKQKGCIYIIAFGGLSNKLNIVSNGRMMKRLAYNVCGYLWEDTTGQVLPKTNTKRLSVPPVDIPYLLDYPQNCQYFFSKMTVFQPPADGQSEITLPPFDECLVIDNLLLSFNGTSQEDHTFQTTIRSPVFQPNITSCIHVRNESDIKNPIPLGEITSLIPYGHEALLIGDRQFIHPYLLTAHPNFATISADANGILSYCTCRDKPFFGYGISSLSIVICTVASECHWLRTRPKGRPKFLQPEFFNLFSRTRITCL